ncbi:hypothetical protein [Corynebacterium callunae]|uniref:hypothetical protein n=1 Tax=Corynebacterium callunae TaxID=1721 RepID=UPI001FFE3BA6|nr:hypothetical protein [Corynebacterium callunae]MCK2199156.1 hypothetical protein [Corynebacterium callunae]
MQKLRLRKGVIEQIKSDRNLASDFQVAAILGVSAEDVDSMRHGAAVSVAMAAHIAVVQGSGFDLSEWVEFIPARESVAA